MTALTQTTALFVDAYRELNARRMFWVTLILSAVAIGVFALLGVSPTGLTIFSLDLPVPEPRLIYKWAFSFFLIGIWAKWAALILALVSTASIFPELISTGSIDLYLSKPISRVRLYLTKFATGLLFVALQTSVFAAGSFLVFGLRLGEWRPSLFLMVPLILLLYSYLFCVCVLFGVLTRSTIASILLTVLFWFICFGINAAESGLHAAKVMYATQTRGYERQAAEAEAEIRDLKARPSVTNLFGVRASLAAKRRDAAAQAAAQSGKTAEQLRKWHTVAFVVASAIPKTGETVDLLDRKLFTDADLEAVRGDPDENPFMPEPPDEDVAAAPSLVPTTGPTTGPTDEAIQEAAREAERHRAREDRRRIREEAAEAAERAQRRRSVPWIIGTSLAFEAIVLLWAGWVFCRRDY